MYCFISRFVENSGTGNCFTSHVVCKTMSCDELTHSSITKSQAVLKSERKLFTSCIKVQFSSPEFLSSVVEAETSLSLEKELQGASSVLV